MLIQHHRDILAELSAAGADYLLVGAFAIAVHDGRPKDLADVAWLEDSKMDDPEGPAHQETRS